MEQVATEAERIPTVCGGCYSCCSMVAHRVDGKVVKLEGNPDSPQGEGRLCAKGVSMIWNLYDPNRITVPLRRTNPEKGIGIDPKWEEISWDEALDEITEKMQKILKDDPRKFLLQITTIRATAVSQIRFPFLVAFGSPNTWNSGGGVHCGNGAHFIAGLFHASWDIIPDWDRCNYVLAFGTSVGHSAGHSAGVNAHMAARARDRGMKLVAFDPIANHVGAKATEWVPILPGTDSAVMLAMLNVILNDLGIWDEPYLQSKTNGPYLVGPDGAILKDRERDKPLVWDRGLGRALPFDDPAATDPAILGTFEIDGTTVQPAFEKLKNHLQKYSCETAEEISGVPAANIRRIAKEFAEAAQVGSTIVIDGKELPYRPASAVIFRGAQGHTNSVWTCICCALLNHVLGNGDVPGGTLGWPVTSHGYPDTGRFAFQPFPDENGMLVPGRWFGAPGGHVPRSQKEEIKLPEETIGFKKIFPYMTGISTPGWSNPEEFWQKLELPYRIEMIINQGCNSIMSMGNPRFVENFLKTVPFIV
ncbi:MAG: molybdopterin-dependent oxidoreductase, partial [bacterium]